MGFCQKVDFLAGNKHERVFTMKKLTCEMCGGTDLLKQEGVFVCQSCSTQYSVEEAKKMMIEGTVEVAGTVKVDTSSRLSNLYGLARKANASSNIKQAFNYYEQIAIEDPQNWEPIFYVTYFQAVLQMREGEIDSPILLIASCVKDTFDLIEGIEDYNEQISASEEVSENISVFDEAMREVIFAEDFAGQ